MTKRLGARVLVLAGIFWTIAVVSASPIKQTPDFSGKWELNFEQSDDVADKIHESTGSTRGIEQSLRRQIAERLLLLGRAAENIEIEQTSRDFKIFDQSDNLRIYYIDENEHSRQTPWGESLQTRAGFDGQRLIVTTKGKDLGDIAEIYGFEGRQLVFIFRVRSENFENEILVRQVYDRADDP